MSNAKVDELVSRALTASERGNWDEAMKLARQAIDIDPGHYLAHKRLSLALWFTGDRDGAFNEMENCLALKPDFESGHYNLACFHALNGNRDGALASLARAIELADVYRDMARHDSDFASLHADPDFMKLCGPRGTATGDDKDASYYRVIHGKKYDRQMLDIANEAVSGRGDGRISKEDTQRLFAAVADANAYTDVEKATMAYIRGNYRWTDAADQWFRTEIRKWAARR